MNEYTLYSKDAIEQRSSTGWLLKWNLGDKWIKSPGFIGDIILWDSYSEILAYNVAVDIGIKRHLVYKPCIITIDNKIKVIGCESKNFNKQGYNEVTLQKLYELGYFSDNKELYDSIVYNVKDQLNLDIRTLLEDIIVLDSVILNGDRKLWNISILVNNNGRAIEAPIYDSGSSLGLNTYKSGIFYTENTYMDVVGFKSHPFYDTFEEQLKLVRKNRKYRNNLSRTLGLIEQLRTICKKENNIFNIRNTLDDGQLLYIETLLKNRLNITMKEIGA